MKILVRRTGALGDVVLATPIVRWLRKMHPEAEITVQTAYPDVFRDNPNVDYVVTPDVAVMIRRDDPSHRLIDLDLAYEKRPMLHIVQAYFAEVHRDMTYPHATEDYRQELFFDRRPLFSKSMGRFVAVHAAHAGWRNRTLPKETWLKVMHGLRERRLYPILVGTGRDVEGIPPGLCPTMTMPDLRAQARLINSCACFVGSDSGLLHVAGATDVGAIVGVFTSVRPEYRLPFRERCVAVVPSGLDCLGCLERQPAPTTVESCERGDVACVRAVRAEDIVEAVVNLVTITMP